MRDPLRINDLNDLNDLNAFVLKLINHTARKINVGEQAIKHESWQFVRLAC